MKLNDLSLLTTEEKLELIILQAEENNLQKEQIRNLKEKIKRLESKEAKNSKNSHKPPSSDQNKPKKTNSLRKKSSKKRGGQPGHKGYNLARVDAPDEVITHCVDNCLICGSDLSKAPCTLDSRQVFDIPKPKMMVTEHRIEIKSCKTCSHTNKALYPFGVNQPTQYGARTRGLMVYLNKEQLLPYRRTKLLFKAIYNHNISVGTVVNAVNYIAERLSNIEPQIKELLKKAPVLHADETGTNVTSSKHWLHVACTDKLTHYGIHTKRGSVAMNDIGILPSFTGIMVHDHWSSYYVYEDATHAMCNAHILRELKFIHEHENFKWASKMTDLLYDMKKSKDAFLQSPNDSPPIEIENLEKKYSSIITTGRREQAVRGTNNSKKLLKRLTEYRDNILLFLHDIIVPFTNNIAERDIRMEKVRLKISGGFRTLKGAQNNCTIKSVLSTGNKNSKNPLEILVLAFQEQLNINLLADL